jgi:hypothetical protein
MGVGLAALAAACGFVAGGMAAPARVLNPVERENRLAGTTTWRLQQAPAGAIEGYASEVSVQAGQAIRLHVSTAPAARYRVMVYRIGWYGGMGGRLVACVPGCQTGERGVPQPTLGFDPLSGYLNAGWPVTDTIRVGRDWTSGYYLVELVLTTGPKAGQGGWVPVIVRELPGQDSQILLQAPVNTWQAYNDWGGRSLYFNYSGVGDNHVSFDRPYDPEGLVTAAGPTRENANLPQEYEFPLVRFLERYGYDVSYTTDVDTDRDPAELLRHRLVIAAGHDEYWTNRIRDAFDHARALGTNLAFLGANTGYWQIRYAEGRRTIIEYRSPGNDPEPDPALKTTTFRTLTPPRPECELLGVESADDTGPGDESIGIDDYSVNPAAVTDPWFNGTGFTTATVFPKLVGYEWDLIRPHCHTPALTDLFHYAGPVPADGVRYTARSGARVFSAGSLRFSWALDPGTGPGDHGQTYANEGLQRFMRNALDDLTRPAAPTAVQATVHGSTVRITVKRHLDPRIQAIVVYRGQALLCNHSQSPCTDQQPPKGRQLVYTAFLRDRWNQSAPTVSNTVELGRAHGPRPIRGRNNPRTIASTDAKVDPDTTSSPAPH